MSRSISDALEQLEQLYMMRLLHQTLRDRLEEAQAAVSAEVAPPPRMLMEIFRLPQQLEEIMLMRAITMSMQQQQPSSAPPPISKNDSDHLEKVTLTSTVVHRLKKREYSECPICQENFDTMIGDTASRLPCDHLFCVHCIDEWLHTSRTCPVCRLELVDVEKQYDAQATENSPNKKKVPSILSVTPPRSPAIHSLPTTSTIRGAGNSGPVSQPTLRRDDVVSEFRQLGVGATRSSAVVQEPSDNDEDEAAVSEEEEEPNYSHQALLDEILRRRDEQRSATLALPPPTVAPPASSTSIRPQPSVRANETVTNQPRPPRQAPTKSTAVLAPGRVRPAPRTSSVSTTSQRQITTGSEMSRRTSQVGVRGLLNNRRQS